MEFSGFFFNCRIFVVPASFQRHEAENASSLLKQRTKTLEQAFGVYEAAFCATAHDLPDVDSAGTTPSPLDGPLNVFQKQDSAIHVDRTSESASSLKRSHRTLHITPEDDQRGKSPDRNLPHKTPRSKSEQSCEIHKRDNDNTAGRQQHKAFLCVY